MTAAADLAAVAARLDEFPEQAVRRAVTTFRDAIRPRLRTDTGGDFRLSGIGRSRLSVSVRVTGSVLVEGTVNAGPKKMRGPWRWLEDGTRPRTDVWGRTHPGTPPKRTWSAPTDRVMPDVQAGIARDFVAVIR